MKKILIHAVIGALLGAFCLTFLFVLVSSPEVQREAGFGWGIFILFLVAPFNAVFGAYSGAAIGIARLALASNKAKKAGLVCIGAGGFVIGIYILLYAFISLPSPAAMHHISAVTGEPTSHAQDVRDALPYCVPLVVALPLLGWGVKQLLSRKTS